MADSDVENSLALFSGIAAVVEGVISEIAKQDASSSERYYRAVEKENELRASDLRSQREHEEEMERIYAQEALMRQRMADAHDEEMARIEAAQQKEKNAHEEEMARIAATERLKSQENELKKQFLETAERAYTKKLEYLEKLQKNAQDYFVPLRDKLVALIEQTEYSCKAKPCTGAEFDANISRLEGLRASLDKCNRDYKELMFKLEMAASNAKLELPSANPQGGMIEHA
ncbi:MAG: hypothetical protein K6G18_01685 [Treponema sp.]|nr:hypothetical protein [Treponema sp.]